MKRIVIFISILILASACHNGAQTRTYHNPNPSLEYHDPEDSQPKKKTQVTAGYGPYSVCPWFVDRDCDDGYYCGFGESQLPLPVARTETAKLRARQDIAQQVQTIVKQRLTDFFDVKATSVNDDTKSTIIQKINNMSENLVNIDLSGSIPDQQCMLDDGKTWLTRVSMPSSALAEEVIDVIDSEKEAFIDYKDQQSYDMMKQSLREEFGDE